MRFNKEHACFRQLNAVLESSAFIPNGDLTAVPLCVGETLHQKYGMSAFLPQAVDIYREFYKIDKANFAKWEKSRPSPSWWAV